MLSVILDVSFLNNTQSKKRVLLFKMSSVAFLLNWFEGVLQQTQDEDLVTYVCRELFSQSMTNIFFFLGSNLA